MPYNVSWLFLVAENTRLTLNLKQKMESTNQTLNEAENGNKSKPLLPAVFLSTMDKQQKFLAELKALLVKYNAELNVTDHRSSDDRLLVEFNYDESFFEIEGTGIIPDLDLGRWEDGR